MRPPHKLVTFSGDVVVAGAVLEQWSFSLRCEPDLTNTPAQDAAAAIGAKDAYVGWMAGPISNVAVLKRVRVASVNALGKYATTADGQFLAGEWVGSSPGANGSLNYLPLQSALVVSLMTARAGATGRGRFFIPTPRHNLDVDGRLTVQGQTDALAAAKGFINAMNAVPELGRVIVSSSKGYESLVTGVRVGRAIDTLRSRRGNVLEAYAASTL
jgi:hypothetical protein